jgi:hypothetical protein
LGLARLDAPVANDKRVTSGGFVSDYFARVALIVDVGTHFPSAPAYSAVAV